MSRAHATDLITEQAGSDRTRMRALADEPSAVSRAADAIVAQIRAQMGSRSIRSVAKGAGVAHGTLVKLLSGETLPSFETLVQLCEVLNIQLLTSIEAPQAVDEEHLWARFRIAVAPIPLELRLAGGARFGLLRPEFPILIRAAMASSPAQCRTALRDLIEARRAGLEASFIGVLFATSPSEAVVEHLRHRGAEGFWPVDEAGRVFVDSGGREWNPRTRQRRIA